MMIKISSRGRVTLPRKAYDAVGNTVKLRKAQPPDLRWLRAISPTLAEEWGSVYDHENFADL